jgi:hypothetical protein
VLQRFTQLREWASYSIDLQKQTKKKPASSSGKIGCPSQAFLYGVARL